MNTFDVGDLVRVVRQGDYKETFAVGRVAKVESVYPNRLCEEDEVILEGSGNYHLVDNLEVVEAADAMDNFFSALAIARKAGHVIEVKVTESVTKVV